MKTIPTISDVLVEFLESGLSITVSTRNGDLEPHGAGAWAATVHEDRAGMTVFLYDKAARELLPNLRSHPEIAVLFDQPSANRACQVKGRFVASRRARVAERAVVERQVEGFVAELEAIGLPRAMTAAWKTWPCTALEMRVDRLFEQSPGPGSGEPLK